MTGFLLASSLNRGDEMRLGSGAPAFRAASGSLCLAVLASGTSALAQVGPNPAPQAPRGATQTLPSRQQVEEPLPTDRRAQRRPSISVARLPEPGPCPLTGDATVMITHVVFTPARAGPLPPELADVLASVAAPTTGAQPIHVICDIRDAANQALSRAGYVASVQIPPQEIATGTLTLSVVAARIVETRVTGYDGNLPAGIARRIEAIRGIDPLNRSAVERQLLLASDTPGLTFRLVLQPAGREPGDVIAVIEVDQQKALVLANFQTTGSRALGPALGSLRAAFYNVTGLADETYFSVSQSSMWDEVHVVQAGHSLGLGTGGVRVGIRGSYALSNPDIPGLDLRSRSLVTGLDLSAPIARGYARTGSRADEINAYVGGGFELLNQRSIIRSGMVDQPYTRDRLRIAYARIGARVISRDAFGVARADTDLLIEVRKGLSVLNATPLGLNATGFQPSRIAGDPQAFVVRGTAGQTIRPISRASWLALDTAFYGQWANHPLLNLEEFSVGNLTYGRGYDPGANAGDRAVAIRVSPRVRLTRATSDVQVEALGFYDAVRLWNRDPSSSEADRLLQSVGGGVRLTMADRLALEVTYAKPLDKALTTDAKRAPERVLFSLTTQFAPWRFGR